MSKKQVSSERMFLFTLVDLLLQMLFVFFAIVMLSESRAAKAERELRASSATGELTRLREDNSKLSADKQNLESQLAQYRKSGALGKPPCICSAGVCTENSQPVYIAKFEVRDDGIYLAGWNAEFSERQSMEELAGKTFSPQGFSRAFRHLAVNDCRHYVLFKDMTSGTNKAGYKKLLSALDSVFYKMERK